MDPSSTLAIALWVLLLLIGSAGSAAQAVVAHVESLEANLLAAQTTRVRRVDWLGRLATALAFVGTTMVAVYLAMQVGPSLEAVAGGAGLSVLINYLAQEVGEAIARRQVDRLARPLLGDAAVFLPLIEPHPTPAEPEEAREETVEQMVDAGEKAGLIESGEHEMISGVLGLDRTLAREIMVPRIDVVAVQISVSLRSALEVVIEGSHSRVPVYEESIDHIVGFLYSKDLLRALRDGKADEPLESLLRPAYFVPESKPVDELLQELQSSKVHMAVVVDEYGGTAGIVTIEDILEEIVGEIQDEYDVGEEPLVERVGENEGVFNARVNVDVVNDTLAVSLPEDSDTLGGLVYGRLQKMAKVGDQVQVDGVTISVLSVVGRRIKKVRVAKLAETAETNGEMIEAERSAQ